MMADFAIECPSCKQEATERIGQAIAHKNTLVWSRGIACPHCNYALEMDTYGFPPSSVREAILTQDDAWSLIINDSTLRTAVAKTLRQIFVLDLRGALDLVGHLPGAVWVGTECEVDWLARHLADNDLRTTKVHGAAGEITAPPALRVDA
jgi:hypothetical protein